MRDPLKRELRRILRGFIDYDEQGNLIAAERSQRLRMLGLFNGTGAAGVFGVAVRRRSYAFSKSTGSAAEAARNAFACLGRRVALDTEPDLTAVFYSPILFNPAVLTAELSGDGALLIISVYTARTLTSGLNAAHAFRRWRRCMPGGLRETTPGKEKRRKHGRDRSRQKGPAQRSGSPDAENDAVPEKTEGSPGGGEQ